MLNPKHKEFADEYIETGNATQSVKEVFEETKNDECAAVKGHRLLRNVKVKEYLESKAERAAIRVVELSEQDENKPVALGASKDILDRAGLKPTDKSENTSTIKIIESSKEGIDKYKLYEVDKSTSTDTK